MAKWLEGSYICTGGTEKLAPIFITAIEPDIREGATYCLRSSTSSMLKIEIRGKLDFGNELCAGSPKTSAVCYNHVT